MRPPLVSGDVVEIDFGVPVGFEAGFTRPAVVIGDARHLIRSPSVVFAIPLTSTPRSLPSHVPIVPDHLNGLTEASVAQAEHLRSISALRVTKVLGNVGPVILYQLTDIVVMLLGAP
jgi:mRNA-degrading endonuclease toxin of MazEF toxin-antitoxin module